MDTNSMNELLAPPANATPMVSCADYRAALLRAVEAEYKAAMLRAYIESKTSLSVMDFVKIMGPAPGLNFKRMQDINDGYFSRIK